MSDKPIPNARMGSLFSKKKDTAIMSNESRVMKHESETTEPEVMSNESKANIHDSLLMSNESIDMSHYKENVSHESLPMKHESGIVNIDPLALNSAVAQGCKDPRISTYSTFVMSVLRYLRKTTPEFSMSDVASRLLEEAIRKQYPELSKQVDEALAKK
jgi:hypothetical protein